MELGDVAACPREDLAPLMAPIELQRREKVTRHRSQQIVVL